MMEIFLICCYAKNEMGYENLSAMSRFLKYSYLMIDRNAHYLYMPYLKKISISAMYFNQQHTYNADMYLVFYRER